MVPRAFLVSSEGDQVAVLCNDRNTDREASECEEKNGCQHGRAEPLYFFHHEAIRPFGLSSERTQGLAFIASLLFVHTNAVSLYPQMEVYESGAT